MKAFKLFRARRSRAPPNSPRTVAQIFNLLYRRFVTCLCHPSPHLCPRTLRPKKFLASAFAPSILTISQYFSPNLSRNLLHQLTSLCPGKILSFPAIRTPSRASRLSRDIPAPENLSVELLTFSLSVTTDTIGHH